MQTPTNPETWSIEPFDPARADEAEFAALHAFTTAIGNELAPDDPRTPLAEAVATWRNVPAFANLSTWLARAADGTVLARAQLSCPRTAENRHLARGSIQVLPEARRRGLARALLSRVAETMRAEERSALIGDTNGRAPAGAAFAERLGARRGLETRVQQLRIATLDRGLLARWQAQARERASGYALEHRTGAWAEADLPEIAALFHVMNTQPTGTLSVEPQRTNPDHLRQLDAALLVRGVERRTTLARETATGRLAGFTEYYRRASAPDLLQTGNTGVFPEHRNRGLGRWLKAAALEDALAAHPGIRFARTANADTNAAMLQINRELGFEPYTSQTIWELEIGALETYLAAAGTGDSAPVPRSFPRDPHLQ